MGKLTTNYPVYCGCLKFHLSLIEFLCEHTEFDALVSRKFLTSIVLDIDDNIAVDAYAKSILSKVVLRARWARWSLLHEGDFPMPPPSPSVHELAHWKEYLIDHLNKEVKLIHDSANRT